MTYFKYRDYQLHAAKNTGRWLSKNKGGNALIVAPTASGKGLIITCIIEKFLGKDCGRTVLVLCNQGEILRQNERTLNLQCPLVETGIYCAGLGRKESDAQILFASRQSVIKSEDVLNRTFDLIIVDEAHLVGENYKSEYQRIFRRIKTRWGIIGFTGTPFRTDNGHIFGEGKFFTAVTYNIKMSELMRRGYLCRYRFPKLETRLINSSHLKTGANGDFKIADIEREAMQEQKTDEALYHWNEGERRRLTLIFCASVAHAEHVESRVRRITPHAKTVTGKIGARERKEIYERAINGDIEVLITVDVITTGIDIPPIDCIISLRPTKSAALFVQMNGRGLRVCEGKKDLLIYDYTDNFDRFGSIEEPFVYEKEPGNVDDERLTPLMPMVKECPACLYEIGRSCRTCPYCGHLFLKICDRPRMQFTNAEQIWFAVERYRWEKRLSKAGNPMVAVSFTLKNRGQPIWQYLLYDSKAPQIKAEAEAFIKKLETARVEMILVTKLNERFPTVLKYITSDKKPVARFEISASNRLFNFNYRG